MKTPKQRASECWKELVLDTEDRKPEKIIEQAIYEALREFVEEMKRRDRESDRISKPHG